MRTRALKAVAGVVSALMLVACGGGGGDSGSAPAPAPSPGTDDRISNPDPGGSAPSSYTIKGNITIAESTTLDADTNDPQQPNYASNDTTALAQSILNPTLVVGHMGKAGQGPTGPNFDNGDLADYFRVSLQAGQVIELEFSADPSTIDLDLFLLPVAGGARVGVSEGVNKYECIRVTRAGDYYIHVAMFTATSSGGTVYQLKLNPPDAAGTGSTTNCANTSSSTVIPGELIGQLSASSVRAANAGLGAKSVLPSGVALTNGEVEVGRPVLLSMSADSASRDRALTGLSEKIARKTLARSGLSAGQIAAKNVTELQSAYSILAGTDLSPDDRAVIETVAMAKLMRASGEYDYVEPNVRVNSFQSLTGTYPPSDRDYARQRWNYELINVPAAMQTINSAGLSGTVRPIVAVLDTGVFLAHPDLASQLVGGYDFVPASSSGDGDGFDSNADDTARAFSQPSFHGTHVAGTVAAIGFNGIGGLGVAPMAQIMPVRVLGEGGGSNYGVIQGIRFAARLSNDSGALPARRADVINMSLGAQGSCQTSMRDAVAAARAAGTIVVAASGNESTSSSLTPIGSPANCFGVMSVGSVGPNKVRSSFSNGGAGLWVSAPGGSPTNLTGNPGGDSIYSTLAEYRGAGRSATYGGMMGTSMAAPHVAGVMALMRYANPAITVEQIDSLLANFTIVDDIGATGRDSFYGLGLINARKSVEAALAARGVTATPGGRVEAQPSNLSLGALQTETDLLIDRIGSSTETVVSVSASTSAITVAAKTATSVNATTRLGTYVVRANRTAIPPGTTQFPEVVITTSSRVIRVPVVVENRAPGAVNGNLGPIYLLVYDAKGAEDAEAVAVDYVASPVSGVYSYTITVTAPAGTANPSSIYLYAGADLDNDGFICGGGEACGAYPVLSGVPLTLYPRGNLTNIDFSVAPFGGINASAFSSGKPWQGFRRPEKRN